MDVDLEIAPESGGQPKRRKERVVMPEVCHDFIPPTEQGQENIRVIRVSGLTWAFARRRWSWRCLDVTQS